MDSLAGTVELNNVRLRGIVSDVKADLKRITARVGTNENNLNTMRIESFQRNQNQNQLYKQATKKIKQMESSKNVTMPGISGPR